IAAPRNGWGVVGLFPPARIVSVRAAREDAGASYTRAYASGIYECLESGQPVRVINMSIADGSGTPADVALLARAVRDARERGGPRWDRARRRGSDLRGGGPQLPGRHLRDSPAGFHLRHR